MTTTKELAESLPIVNPGDGNFYDEQYRRIHGKSTMLFRMWAGEGDPTRAYVWADSFESAFEEFVEWLDDNAPGHLTDIGDAELKEAAEELDIKWKPRWLEKGTDAFEDGDFVRVVEKAETDLTVIGHTSLKHGQYIPSWEWGGDEIFPGEEHEIVVRRSKAESPWDDEGNAKETDETSDRDDEDFARNPPSWVRDEDVWQEAKAAVRPQWGKYEDPWAVVTTTYEQMGGRVGRRAPRAKRRRR